MNAKDILLWAVQLDSDGRVLEAQMLYQYGIQILKDRMPNENDLVKKKVLYDHIKDYYERAKQIEGLVRNQMAHGQLIASISIDENSNGHSYQSLFAKYLNADMKEMIVEESFMQEKHQFHNLVIFLELVVKNCPALKFVQLVTKPDTENVENQKNVLQQIQTDLRKRDIMFRVIFKSELHDRKIVLSNGYLIKLGRGLDLYKPTTSLYSLGLCDRDFRSCKTSVDIFRTRNLSG